MATNNTLPQNPMLSLSTFDPAKYVDGWEELDTSDEFLTQQILSDKTGKDGMIGITSYSIESDSDPQKLTQALSADAYLKTNDFKTELEKRRQSAIDQNLLNETSQTERDTEKARYQTGVYNQYANWLLIQNALNSASSGGARVFAGSVASSEKRKKAASVLDGE